MTKKLLAIKIRTIHMVMEIKLKQDRYVGWVRNYQAETI